MRRREFIAELGGAAAWSITARAQQGDRVRRVGVLMSLDENDPDANALLSGFTQGLGKLGWSDGRNERMDIRYSAGNIDQMRTLAKELVALQPDVILAMSTPVTAALHRETQTIPIVFVGVSDPVGEGFVASLSRPGGNLTGFIYTEVEMASKWLALLTEIAPGLKRAAIIFNPDTAPGGGLYYPPLFEAAARALNVVPVVAPVHSDGEIESIMALLGRQPVGGGVVVEDAFMLVHRSTIISLASRNHVPAIYGSSTWPRNGGLLSYGIEAVDLFRRAAPYVDRILRGVKPVDLPVQLPVKFEMALNAKTAKALGLTVPQSILLSADEVIE
jgi:putative tryptophan/tyrosine transport system substrate-binding protein